jgi:hypothetical protein
MIDKVALGELSQTLLPVNKNLRKHARRCLCFEVEITTNTLAVVQLEPAHAGLINRICTLAESGLTVVIN